jgi:outer membrane lipoprotein SlyB
VDELIYQLITIPRWAASAIFGAIGGALGALLATRIKSQRAKRVAFALGAIVAVSIGNGFVRAMQIQYSYLVAMKKIEETRLYSALIRYHPEARDQIIDGLKRILVTSSGSQITTASARLGSDIVNRYYNKDMLQASSETLFEVLRVNSEILHYLRSSPADCIAFYLGTASDLRALPAANVEVLSDAKAAVIESAGSHPTPPSQVMTIKEMMPLLSGAYASLGRPVAELARIDKVQTLLPTDGCTIATDFSDALVTLGQAQGTEIFKSLAALGSQ